MGLFDVNYPALIKQRLAVRWRYPVMQAWLNALAQPVKYVFGLFTINRNANIYNLTHTGQVCRMEGALNDTFDTLSRRIFIIDAIFYDPVYLYRDDELKPVFIDLVSEIGTAVIPNPDPVPLFTSTEITEGDTFIVNVPSSITFDNSRMIALINKYRLPGMVSYTIVTF